LAPVPVVLLLLCGACSRSESEAPKPKDGAKPEAAAPAAAKAPVAKPDNSAGSDAPKEVSLVVYCAQEVRGPVEEIAQDIRTSLGLDCRLECAGAPELLSKVKRMRQGDILVLDHADYVTEAENEGLVKPGAGKTLAYLEPVILVAKGNPKQIKSLDDFRRVADPRSGVKAALADPEKCGLGFITQRIFEENKIPWAAIEPHCQLKVAAEHLLILPASQGLVDLCVVRHAEAARIANVCDSIPIPPKQNVLSTVMAAPLVVSQHPQEAQQVVDYMAGDLGKVVFKKFKYKQEVDPVLLANARSRPGSALDGQGFIREWLTLPPIVVGPEAAAAATTNVQLQLLDKEYFAGQKGAKPTEKMKVKVGSNELTWEPVASDRSTVNFPTPEKTNYVYLAATYVIAPQDIPDVALCVNSRNTSMWWLDGKEVIKAFPPRDPEWKSPPMTLTKGVHLVSTAVTRVSGGEAWACARFVDKKNASVEALRVCLSPTLPQGAKP
jgi:molybdate transport system substrate-binding protein